MMYNRNPKKMEEYFKTHRLKSTSRVNNNEELHKINFDDDMIAVAHSHCSLQNVMFGRGTTS